MKNNYSDSEVAINSKKYWDMRFNTDWEEYSGSEQTNFFAKLAFDMIPEWFKRKLRQEKYSICDMGCALGEGTYYLSKHLGISVDGKDVSDEAVQAASSKYPHLNFNQYDVTSGNFDETYNVVFCSNLLEHFDIPWNIFNNLTNIANDYIILQVPFRETLKIEEHFYKFDTNNIPVYVNGFYLVYADVIDGSKIENTFYPDKQILLIYSKHESDISVTYISDLITNISNLETVPFMNQITELKIEKENNQKVLSILREENTKIHSLFLEEEQKKKKLENQLQEQVASVQNLTFQNKQLEKKNLVLEEQKDVLETQLQEKVSDTEILEDKIKKLERRTESLMQKATSYKNWINHLQNDCQTLQAQNNSLKNTTIVLEQEKSENESLIQQLQATIQQLQTKLQHLEETIHFLQQKIISARKEVVRLSEGKVYQFAHLLFRIRYQAFHKNRKERRNFRKWISSKIFRHLGNAERQYNPLFRIIEKLDETNINNIPPISEVAHSKSIKNDSPVKIKEKNSLPASLKKELQKDYTKFDVIVFSVIDYDFRYQRPQQIADHFAQKGHRVFYINANFVSGKTIEVTSKKENLFIVKLPNDIHPSVYSTNFTDNGVNIEKTLDTFVFDYAIRDGLIIADYPTWIRGMEYLKNKYGFPIITDYMDDFTGFDNAQDEFIEEACKRLLTVSNYIVASSQYLVDIAKQYNNHVEAIRNGTEFEHFHTAYQEQTSKKKKPVIGYYGAIAHWFNFEKVEYLAKHMPDADIILIGSVTEKNQLEKYPNIKFLGEKPYRDLPQYLKDFDVCLIPFDTSTNLIKATNPVKFYEYLSAGKKIVATEIPELMPFRDKYVYLSNDNEQFLNYVNLCITKQDVLAPAEECFKFAKQNDWSERVAKFADTANKIFPKISIIVLCYNQINYTRECVESILNQTAYPNYELILVDNNSTDDTADYLKYLVEADDRIKIVLNQDNRGFAGGNNDGIRIANGEFIVLLNNDTVVSRGWLTNMVKRFLNNEELGIVGPVTNSIGNEAQIQVDYTEISKMPEFAYIYTSQHMNQTYHDINVLAMFCVMIRKSMMDKIGLLDENYGIGMFEDDDYCMAAKKAGYKIQLLEDTFIHHYGSVSFKKLENAKYRELFKKNLHYYESKWNTKWKMHSYRKE